MTDGQVFTATSAQKVLDGVDVNNLVFNSTSVSGVSFEYSVEADGSNPSVSEVMYHGNASSVTILKESSRAPLVPVTGVYFVDGGGTASDTFSLIFNTGNGAGDDTDITTQIMVGGADVGTSAGNSQSNCSTSGAFDTCDIAGATIPLGDGQVVSWVGTHTYDNAAGSCSSVTGTWSSNGTGSLTGTFSSDAVCEAPVNDLCAGAIDVICGETITGTIDGATATDNPTAFCGTTPGTGGGVWYTYTSTGGDNDVTVSLCGSSFDTKINVYQDGCGTLTCVGGEDDDFANCGGNDPEFTFNEGSTPGTVFHVLVSGFGTAVGTYVLNVSCVPPPPPPTCSTTVTDAAGAAGAIDDNACPVTNDFVANTAATGNIGVDADIDNVTINIEHTWAGDITIDLVSPTGTVLNLSDGVGGNNAGTDAYVGAIFRDGGEDITAAGTAPFSGIYNPQGGTFATAFDGESITGDWTLRVCDGAGGDTGSVTSWSIGFCDSNIPPPPGNPNQDEGLQSRVANDISKEEYKLMKGIK